jgi:hypothetical protein
MMDSELWTLIGQVIEVAGVVCLIASAIANLTPTETDNRIVAMVSRVVNLLAMNFTVRR